MTSPGYDVRTDTAEVKRPSATAPTWAAWSRAPPRGSTSSSRARLRRLDDWEDRARDLLERFELGDVAHRVTSGFSHGMGRRLSVVLAALHEPEVLLLDEPFDGVDPIGVEATFDVIDDARARGACVLVSTHLRDLAMQACGTAAGAARRRPGRRRRTPTSMSGEEGAVPTARSSTDSWVDAVVDLRHLLRFRAATVRRPHATAMAALVLLAVTLAASVGPLFVAGAGGPTFLDDHFAAMLAGFLTLAIASAMASGGGRELVPREQAAIHPISHRVEHLGALVLSPLNFAWLLQAWLLLGVTSRITGTDGWLAGQVVAATWILCATALAQVLGWLVETVRRTTHGIVVVRGLAVLLATVGVGLQATHRLLPLLESSPTRLLADSVIRRDGAGMVVLVMVVLGAMAVFAGAVPAGIALRRTAREELKVESGSHPARPLPAGDLAVLRRIDRGSVWRSVPMRRGLVVLALGPGLVALGGGMDWVQVLVRRPSWRRRAALRRQRLVPRRAWCAVAREPAGEARPCSPRGRSPRRVARVRRPRHDRAGRTPCGVPSAARCSLW